MCNFPPFYEMADRPAADNPGHREVKIEMNFNRYYAVFFEHCNTYFFSPFLDLIRCRVEGGGKKNFFQMILITTCISIFMI